MATVAFEPPRIEGTCDPRFAAVRDAFAANFVLHGEVGAIRAPLPEGALLDWPRMVQALEQQARWWTPTRRSDDRAERPRCPLASGLHATEAPAMGTGSGLRAARCM